MQVDVEQVAPQATFGLRQAVLRPHEPLEHLALPGDDDPATGTYAAIDRTTGEVVGTANVRLEPAPFDPTAVAGLGPASASWRLRGMATRADLRNRGLGGRVLESLLDHVAAHGGGLLWCNARVRATGFYERAGFRTFGDEWVDPDVGPHVVMWTIVEPKGAQ